MLRVWDLIKISHFFFSIIISHLFALVNALKSRKNANNRFKKMVKCKKTIDKSTKSGYNN